MSKLRQDFIQKILEEREKQCDLPGSEWDMKNTPNDWIAIASYYFSQTATRKHMSHPIEEFEDDMIKAAAVILAALEHSIIMKKSGNLR